MFIRISKKYLNENDRILLIDDFLAKGNALLGLLDVCQQAGATVVGKMAVLAEGDAAKREDITVLAPLPLFHPDGTPIED